MKQVYAFPHLGSLITEDAEYTTEFRSRLNRGQAIGASLQKIWKSHSIPISTKIRLLKALVWPVAMYDCESWTLRKNKESDAFEMKGLRKILRVSWTAKKTNESWSKEGTDRHCQSKVASILWSHHEETRELPGERDNARNNCQVHAGEEDHARPGWTISIRGQDSPWKSQSE